MGKMFLFFLKLSYYLLQLTTDLAFLSFLFSSHLVLRFLPYKSSIPNLSRLLLLFFFLPIFSLCPGPLLHQSRPQPTACMILQPKKTTRNLSFQQGDPETRFPSIHPSIHPHKHDAHLLILLKIWEEWDWEGTVLPAGFLVLRWGVLSYSLSRPFFGLSVG